MNIDLHLHTSASDGSLSPTETVSAAAAADLRVIAITDHDTTAGLDEALEAQERFGVTVVPGVEVSAQAPGGDVHLLGYWMDYGDPAFEAFLAKPRDARPNRIVEMCGRLTDLGLPVNPEEVFEEASGSDSAGRPHLARVMVRKGYVGTMEEAFDRYLRKGAQAHVKRFKNSTDESLAMIHRCGGISVLAHPGLVEDPRVITALIEQGVMGLEVLCHEHPPETVERFTRLAERHGLLMTGGSDYHGSVLEQPFRLGDLPVPYAFYESLRAAKSRIDRAG